MPQLTAREWELVISAEELDSMDDELNGTRIPAHVLC